MTAHVISISLAHAQRSAKLRMIVREILRTQFGEIVGLDVIVSHTLPSLSFERRRELLRLYPSIWKIVIGRIRARENRERAA